MTDDQLNALVPGFLPNQRWFASKARAIAACVVEDRARLREDDGLEVVIVDVSFTEGPAERYALLVSAQSDPGRLPPIGPIGDGTRGWLVEASTDQTAVHALLRGFSGHTDIVTLRGGRLRYGDTGTGAAKLAPLPEVKPVGAEQSNTSLRVGGTLVFKLFRRLETGENPEVEVGRFLTVHTHFRAMSALQGSLTYLRPDGEPCTLGVLQSWVENDGDGWRYLLDRLRQCLADAACVDWLDQVALLGTITSEFHVALESNGDAAFAPEPLEPDDVERWADQVTARASRAFDLMRSQHKSWPGDARRLAMAVLSTADAAGALASVERLRAAPFDKIRIHGDYHLGQTLKTPQGFAIIDFEGEPARPIAERREKHCALRDVAGMLRSFDYAVESASEGNSGDAHRLRSALNLRDVFLAGYLRSADARGARSVPSDRLSLAWWLTLFEFDKALYELEYEINNRPDWVHIPLRGLLHALHTTANRSPA